MWEVPAAVEAVLQRAKPCAVEMTPLASPALGQVLGSSIASDVDSPPFDKSMMDGFALRSADLISDSTELTLVEEIPAGSMPQRIVEPGECSRIFTGAPIPQGADAVVMVERTTTISPNRIRIDDRITPGKNVIPRAKEMRMGDTVIAKGTVLTPAVFGLMATVGKTAVLCHARPRVAIVATGNEIVEPARKPTAGQIRNSNGPMLSALSASVGALPRYLGIARDQEAILRSFLYEGLTTAHVLLITGGVSVGSFDLVPGVLESLGVTIHFHKIRMKPGKPLLFGTKGETLVFGLPGNPVSGFVGFHLFVKPALQIMRGLTNRESRIRTLPLAESLSTVNDRPTYHPARMSDTAVVPLPWFGSADLRGLLEANAMLVLPEGPVSLSIGQPVDVLPLQDRE